MRLSPFRRFWYTRVELGKEVLLLACNAGRRTMAWCRIQLTEDERRVVNEERTSHPNLLVRNKMLTIWLLHCGVTRQKAAEIVGVSRATVQRYVDAYCKGGLDGLRHSSVQKAVSELAAFRSTNAQFLRALRKFL